MRRVLLIEDEPMLSRALCRALGDRGLAVHPVPSAETAFAVLAREAPFDAVVTDLRLPGLSGQELARRLRQPRLIVITGDAASLPLLRHFDAKLLKPVRTDELVAALLG